MVLPTYDEAGNLERLLRELRGHYPHARLMVIDDASPDGTGAVAERVAAELSGIEVVHRSGKLGLGSAHIRGLDRALELGCRYVATMDCDFTHRPEDLRLLLERIEEQRADLVVGSRYVDPASMADWPLHRRLITRTAHSLTRHLLGIPGDATSGFRLYRTAALQRVPYRQVRSEGYSFIFELLFACLREGLVVVEVPVLTPIRQAGESKISRLEILKAVETLLRLALRRMTPKRRRAA